MKHVKIDEPFPEVMFTAHRKLPRGCVDGWLYRALYDATRRLADEFGTERFTTGMATGGDQLAGQIVRAQELLLRAAIPYPDQPLDGTDDHFGPRWTRKQQEDWEVLRAYAQDTGGVEHVSQTNPRSFKERVTLLHQRNDWMLERAQAVVAIWAPANLNSGTASCLRKAASAGKPIILVNLVTQTVTRPLPKHWAEYLNMPALARR